MTGFFDKLPEISPKKQALTQKPVFDPYSFLNLRPEPQTAEDRFKGAKELLSAESNTAIQYLKAAAEEEHAASLDFLGMLYATGQLTCSVKPPFSARPTRSFTWRWLCGKVSAFAKTSMNLLLGFE